MTLRGLAKMASAMGTVALFAAQAAHAQTGCRTASCNFSTTPPVQCTNRATPRTTMVTMTNSGLTFIYVPATTKIEPDDCILWQAVGTIVDHSSSANDCADTNTVCSVVDTTCQWDTGNTAPNDVPPSEVCYYSAAAFLPDPTTGKDRKSTRLNSSHL